MQSAYLYEFPCVNELTQKKLTRSKENFCPDNLFLPKTKIVFKIQFIEQRQFIKEFEEKSRKWDLRRVLNDR